MPIYIHHAETGSFKTSGAIQDHAIPAMKQGRVIVTNIRGMSASRCYEVFPGLPDKFDLIHIDTSTSEGLEKIARFFHWVPLGALLILDEATTCFPKRWRDKDIAALDYPGGIDKAKEDNRPPTWLHAWEMHRHYGWEIVLTTPSIKGIRDDIRQAASIAFLHSPLSHIGLSGYYEAMHNAQKNGASKADFRGDPIRKKIKANTFSLYDSTADGEITPSKAMRPIWKDPKILLGLGIVTIFSGYAISSLTSGKASFLVGESSQFSETVETASTGGALGVPGAAVPVVGSSRINAIDRIPDKVSIEPLRGIDVYIDGFMRFSNTGPSLIQFRLIGGTGEPFIQDSNQLKKLGYKISIVTDCFVRLEFEGSVRWAHCSPVPFKDSDNNNVVAGELL